MKSFRALFLLSMLVVAGGALAQSDQRFTVDYIQKHLKKGVTTPAEAIAAFGEPTSRDALINSEGAADETLVYVKGSKPAGKKGKGIGSLLGAARGIMGDYARATGNSNREVDRALGGASSIADRIGSMVPEQQASEQKSVTLTMNFSGGLLKTFEMR